MHQHFTSSFFIKKVFYAAFFYLQFMFEFFGKRKLLKNMLLKLWGFDYTSLQRLNFLQRFFEFHFHFFIFRKESWPLLTPSVWIARLKKSLIFAIKCILLLSAFAVFAFPFLTPRTEIESKLDIKEVCGTPGKKDYISEYNYNLVLKLYICS